MEELTEEVFINRARIFFYEVAGVESASLDADANLMESGILDSLLLIAFLAFIEKLRGSQLDITPENLPAISSLRGAYAFVRLRTPDDELCESYIGT
jgi:aryl carrier-like protein